MNLLRAGATVGMLTAAGRILGYARSVLSAAFIGAGPLADAFFVALRVPVFVRRLFSGGGVGAAFVPLFTARLGDGGRAPARRLAGEVLSVAAVALVLLTSLLALAAPWLLDVLAPGFEDDPERYARSVELLRVMLPFVLFAGLAQLLGGVLNGAGRFAAAAALPVFFNAVAIAALVVLAGRLDTPAHALAWGVAAAGIVQLAAVALACRRAGLAPRPAWPRLTLPVKRFLGRAGPAVVAVGAAQAMVLVDLAIASLLPAGSVSYLHYADRVARILPSVVGAAAAVPLLPHLARRGAGGRAADPAATSRTLEAGLLLGLPGAAALAVIAGPLVAALFERGAFAAEATAATASALAAYAAAPPAWIAVRTLGSVFFARGDTATPMAVAVAAVGLNLVLGLLLMGPLGHAGIALATALAAWLQAGALVFVLARRGAYRPDARLRRKAPAIAAASLAMAGVLWLVRLALGTGPAAGELARAGTALVLVAAGLASYAALALAARIVRPGDLARAWGARRNGA